MTIQADFSVGYPPSQAENGKFVYLDPSTIPNYPSTWTTNGISGVPTTGRYAQLVYSVGGDASSVILSGGLPNTTNEQLITFSTNASSIINFTPTVTLMEISNRSAGSIYISYSNPVTNFVTLTAAGLEIAKGSFYSIERTITNVTIGSIAGGNVVVFGHYKA